MNEFLTVVGIMIVILFFYMLGSEVNSDLMFTNHLESCKIEKAYRQPKYSDEYCHHLKAIYNIRKEWK